MEENESKPEAAPAAEAPKAKAKAVPKANPAVLRKGMSPKAAARAKAGASPHGFPSSGRGADKARAAVVLGRKVKAGKA